MVDLIDEQLVSMTAAAQQLPRRPHVATLHRWRTRGIRGVQLEAALVGGRWYTSQEALRRFIAATTHAATQSPEAPAPICDNSEFDAALDREGL